MNRWFNGGLHTLANKGISDLHKGKDGYFNFKLYGCEIDSSYSPSKVMYNPFHEVLCLFENSDVSLRSLQIRENYVLASGSGGGENISIRFCECGGQLETSSKTGFRMKVGHESQCIYGTVEEVLSL